MPELVEQMYCSQQIVIPPKFPYILKRYCKAAIKTQPYDLLRWSHEYFKALAQRRAPPVKLRLEYPIFSTEGGLTRGCLKVLANQLSGMEEIPLYVLRSAWQGFCLDFHELTRILCLCEVYLRVESVQFLYFIAVAGGLLTKNLTHTMILLCETLTKEPDGGSAAIPVEHFLTMYRFLARIDASQDIKFINGYREGCLPEEESLDTEEQKSTIEEENGEEEASIDEFWNDSNLQRLTLINDNVARSTRLSVRLNMPILGKISRSPSIEREGKIERENLIRQRKGRAVLDKNVEDQLRALTGSTQNITKEIPKEGEPKLVPLLTEEQLEDEGMQHISSEAIGEEEDKEKVQDAEVTEAERIKLFIAECALAKEQRIEDLQRTFDEIAAIVDKFKSASYDLGMIAGRQMSITSAEFVVQHIEREILDYIDGQIAILPDPDLKKKKAKPEEVAMVRDILETFLDENMDIIVPEIEEVEEEEQPLPEIVVVYAVPGIGPQVPIDIVKEFEHYANDVCKVQADVFMPRNIRHFLCPPLEQYVEHKYDDSQPKEEVPTGGSLAE